MMAKIRAAAKQAREKAVSRHVQEPLHFPRMASPFPVFPDAEMSALAARLTERRDEWLARVLKDHPASLLDGLPASLVQTALTAIHADEGSVWLTPDGGRTLTPCWNNGPQAGSFVGRFQLPAQEGLTGLVFTGGFSSSESEVCFNQLQHRTLDDSLGVFTWAMLAVPLRLAGQVLGVITAVRLIRRADLGDLQAMPRSRADFPPGFEPPPSFSIADLSAIETTAGVLGRLIDHRLHCWLMRIEE